MNDRRHRLGLAICAIGFALAGCSPQVYRFADMDPVVVLGDTVATSVPRGSDYTRPGYYVRSLGRHPLRRALRATEPAPAGDVNALDDVPASSWYTPRLGHRTITPEALLQGPHQFGPPVRPLTVAKAKVGGGNPGFIIADARGVYYLVKFDPPDFPGIETTTALIVNRLFWGFGYNVPEDYTLFVRADELQIDPDGELSRADVTGLLDLVAPPVNGVYRATASRFIDGRILGAIAESGTRVDDDNDLVPHEDRRILRAMHVFCAFTNQSGIRPDNTLDTYVGDPGQGYVKHYLLDFGEAFGGHGAEHLRLWDGYEHILDGGTSARKLVTLGLAVEPWERIRFTRWRSVGAFESDVFEASAWHETYPYLPITSSRPADDYWAAKIVGALTREHVQVLVDAAQYPEPGASDYVVETVMSRRRKILQHYLYQVTPLESEGWARGHLRLRDVGRQLLAPSGESEHYRVRYFDGNGDPIGEPLEITADTVDFEVPLNPLLLQDAGGYVSVHVTLMRPKGQQRPAAQFHLRLRSGVPHLVGIVH